MKTLPKILAIFFLTIFMLQLIGLAVIFSSPQSSSAAKVTFTPQVEIPGSKVGGKIKSTSIGLYIMAIYKYAIGIVGILATVILMFAGLKWITSGGNQEKISDARAWIAAAITGLVLMMASYLILYTVNPELVKIQSIEPPPISEYVKNQNINTVGDWYLKINATINGKTYDCYDGTYSSEEICNTAKNIFLEKCNTAGYNCGSPTCVQILNATGIEICPDISQSTNSETPPPTTPGPVVDTSALNNTPGVTINSTPGGTTNISLNEAAILFDFDSAVFNPEDYPVINTVKDVLQESEGEIQVIGHTDSSGTAEYNLDLSLRRAQSITDWLINNGIPANRIQAIGRGETELIPGATDEQNRRVEIIISGQK